MRRLKALGHKLDFALGRLAARQRILVEVRSPVHHAVLCPVVDALRQDPALDISYTSEFPERLEGLESRGQFVSYRDAEWIRYALYLSADPWAPAPLRRCERKINFFHGVAGKYDLDQPHKLAIGYEGFAYYDRVAFVNRDRMRRYLEGGIVTPAQAVLVGYPKLDRLARGQIDPAQVRDDLDFEASRPTALYAPTYSPASSLHLAGEAIITCLASAGFNVIVKLHDRSLDPDPRYSGGIDWRSRMRAAERPGRIAYVERGDVSALLAAADVMVTDHSSVGFEYLLLDRPLVVFDAPDLPAVARVNPEKVALLRSAAVVVRTPDDAAAAAAREIASPGGRSAARRSVAREMFYEPGTATDRAVALVHSVLRRRGTEFASARNPDPSTGRTHVQSTESIDASILVATYNRAVLLGETLDSFARMRVSPHLRWEVVVIDNNSPDDTRAVVERRQPDFPVPLVYLFEARQGRSSALNTGIAATRGRVLAFTDDDMRPMDGWLDAACDRLLGPDSAVGYVGGPIRPIWGAPPPQWLDLTRGDLWGTIGIHDHGPERFVYEDRRKVPMGGNLAVRRSLFEVIGGYRPDLGRTNGRLPLGQEVPELLLRARAAGVRGLYVPEMEIAHHIPAGRLTRAYFRNWWFGRGVSRAVLERIEPVTELGLDLRRVGHVLGVPRFMYGSAIRDTLGWMRECARQRPADAFRHEMMLAYFAGYLWSRVRQRGGQTGAAPHLPSIVAP